MHGNLGITMRPRSLDEMIGNTNVVAAIRTKLDSGDIPAAILLTGQFGTGKTSLAYIIARLVQGFDFPESKEPQVQEINAADLRGIDAMRELIETTGSFPMPPSKYRVIILDEAHRLTKDAQELLLKEFENERKPTVWIVCTTETNKINKGILSRCLKYETTGLNKEERKELVTRAAKAKSRLLPFDDFLTAIDDAGFTSPRVILAAFETYNDGLPAVEAVQAAQSGQRPEYFDIAFAVVWGKWNEDIVLEWMQGKQVMAVRKQLELLDGKLKKKPAGEEAARPAEVEEVEKEDTVGRNEVARALRAIVAAFLKGRLLSPKCKNPMAFADALDILVKSAPTNEFDVPLEFPATIGAICRVMKRLAPER